MRVTSPTFNPQRRRGVILLVVLAMLTLLTVIGVTFVLYSDSAESTARIAMEGEKSVSLTQPANWPTDELMAYAFGQLIYDAEDDSAGQQSNLRGHSLARDIYGYYYDQTTGPLSSSASSTAVSSKAPDNDRPFRGTGRFDADKDVVNFTTFKTGGTPSIRDPERKDVGTGLLVRTNPAIPNAYVGGFNPSYTFADRNHVFLANTDTDPATGNLRITEPSFVRLASLPNNTLDPANPYWTDPSGDPSKSVRPRPVNHNGQFPVPASATGDVRNLPWGTQNDSVWIDLGVSPKTAPNGKRYKPMFAFLAIDLDGRVNVNAHGNVQGRDGSGTYAQRHASGQGWGAWEVSLERVMNGAQGKAFVLNRQPGLAMATTLFDIPMGGSLPHTYSPVNYNGSLEQALGGALDQPILMPGVASAFSPFGFGDPKAYGQGLPFERSGSSADPAYNGPDRVHGATWHSTWSVNGNFHMKAENLGWTMGRFLRSPSKYSDSDIYKIGSLTSSPFVSSGRDVRFDKLTTMSWDLDRPGLSPYFTDITAQGAVLNPIASNTYNGDFLQNYPKGAQSEVGFQIPANVAPQSNFDTLNRSANQIALKNRLNLNRRLSNYPTLQGNGLYAPNDAALINAQNDRQIFAEEILQSLILATGAANPSEQANAGLFAPNSTNPRYLATRWLAQLAVNIVDQIDSDDVMTAFVWNKNNDNNDILRGQELSRLVINEVYAQIENTKQDLMQAMNNMKAPNDYVVNVFAELYNPLPAETHAQVKSPKLSQYRFRLVPTTKFNPLTKELFNNGNIDLTANNLAFSGQDQSFEVNPSMSPYVIIGPNPDNQTSDIDSNLPNWDKTKNRKELDLSFQVKAKQGNMLLSRIKNDYASIEPHKIPVLVMERVADPGLAPDPNTNPYILLDYAVITPEMLDTCDARKYIIKQGMTDNAEENNKKVDVEKRHGFAKPQPYTYLPPIYFNVNGQNLQDIKANFPSFSTEYGSLVPSFNTAAPTGEPDTTFGQPNLSSSQGGMQTYWGRTQPNNSFNGNNPQPQPTLETPFVRVHHDRILTSPTELFVTPFGRPHEFLSLNTAYFSYCSPWFDTNTRLYRWLELVQAGDTRSLYNNLDGAIYSVGSAGGRIPGKINLNTVSREVFFALCDAQSGNRFNDTQINALYDKVVSLRPFWGNGVGSATGADAISAQARGRQQTILANHPAGQGADMGDTLSLLMDPLHQNYNGGPLPTANGLVPAGMGNARQQEFHPSVRQELLNKILGRTTSRSNCFAVWLTVGFFEVINENGGGSATAQPVHVLGKELEPKIRKRFFAMVDRTSLERWKTNIVDATNNPMSTPDPLVDMDPNDYIDVPLSALYVPAATPTTLSQPNAVSNSLNFKQFSISFGNVLTIDPGNPFYEETVEVIDIGMGTPGIRLKKAHPSMIISSRGNPGPMPNLGLDYKIDKDTEVVPYFAVLE